MRQQQLQQQRQQLAAAVVAAVCLRFTAVPAATTRIAAALASGVIADCSRSFRRRV
jgi:hypothetical protein